MKPYRIPLPGVVPVLRWKCSNIPFDLIHAYSPFGFGHAARNIARARKIPCVGTFHSKYYQKFRRHIRSNTIAKAVVRYISNFYQTLDMVFTMNPACAKVLRSYGYHGEVTLIRNGVDMEPLWKRT